MHQPYEALGIAGLLLLEGNIAKEGFNVAIRVDRRAGIGEPPAPAGASDVPLRSLIRRMTIRW